MTNQDSDYISSFFDQDLFEIQLSENRKKMLQHYFITGQILRQSQEQKKNVQKLNEKSMVLANRKLQGLSVINQVNQQYLQSVFIDDHKNNKNQNKRLSFIDKLELRQQTIRKHQNIIIAMMFQLKLINKLDDNLETMLEEAQIKYSKKSKQYENQDETKNKHITQTILSNDLSQFNQIKTQLAHQLAQSLIILTQKRIYKKYCYYTYKSQKIQGSFSIDFKHFVYKIQGKDSIKADSMEEYKGYSLGKTTKNFKRYLKKNQQPQDNLSFSLIFNNRTLDISAETPDQRNQFIDALKELEKYL